MDFYSQDNINILQAMIHDAVMNQLQVDIPLQKENELFILMRAVKNESRYIDNTNLNQLVVNRALSIIAPKVALSRADRTKNMGSAPVPMGLPVNMSVKGARFGEYNIGV